MATPFIGEIVFFGGNFAPRSYAFCDGQLLSISQNTALFSILGTTYGGDGQTTFALPDLRGRSPLHVGGAQPGPGQPSYALGQSGGVVSTTLTVANLPPHNHSATFTSTGGTLTANTAKGTAATPAAGLALSRGIDGDGDPNAVPFIYGPAPTTGGVALSGVNAAGTVAVGVTGSGTPAATQSPYLGINALIATQGIFPSRN